MAKIKGGKFTDVTINSGDIFNIDASYLLVNSGNFYSGDYTNSIFNGGNIYNGMYINITGATNILAQIDYYGGFYSPTIYGDININYFNLTEVAPEIITGRNIFEIRGGSTLIIKGDSEFIIKG